MKEPDNEVDKEAIKVQLNGLGLIGYVANSPFTVMGESMSIRFKGRQAIDWDDVERYLKKYVEEAHIIESTEDMVYIGADLPEE